MGWFDWFRRKNGDGGAPPPAVAAAPEPGAPAGTLDERIAPYRRQAWIPQVAEGDGAPDGSKFSGRPWLHPGEAWPACGNCHRPMQLFVQLDARDLPPEAAPRLDGGIFQLFYCTSTGPACEVDAEAWAPGARSTLARLVAPDASGGGAGAPGPGPEGMFPPGRIVGWTAADDYPNWEELQELGAPITDEEWDELADGDFPRQGEKLLGWPFWVQGVEYPACPECGKTMELLFQVDSERNLPYMFGDAGVGHVTQCPVHRHRLAFGWACY